jgi:hypothetical protein
MSFPAPGTSTGSNARRAGSNSPPRSNCRPGPRPGPAQYTARNSVARFASPSADRDGSHCCSVSTASAGEAQMTLPVGAGVFACYFLGHSAWLTPWLTLSENTPCGARRVRTRIGGIDSLRWHIFSEARAKAHRSPRLAAAFINSQGGCLRWQPNRPDYESKCWQWRMVPERNAHDFWSCLGHMSWRQPPTARYIYGPTTRIWGQWEELSRRDRRDAGGRDLAPRLPAQLRRPGASWPVRATYSV